MKKLLIGFAAFLLVAGTANAEPVKRVDGKRVETFKRITVDTVRGDSTNRAIKLNTYDGGAYQTRVYIDAPNGNVGIGTTDPQSSLFINGSALGDRTPTANTTLFSQASAGPAAELLGAGASYSGNILNIKSNRTSSSDFNFIKVTGDDDGTPFYPFLITGTGNIGIGTTGPTEKLDVAGNIIFPYQNILESKTAEGAVVNLLDVTYGNRVGRTNVGRLFSDSDLLGFEIGQHGYASIYANAGDPAKMMGFYVNSAERIRIDASGNVGIGTTAPVYKLEVNGTAQADDYYSGDGTQGITQSETGVTNFDIVIKDGLITSFTKN